jgi:hypothetical protein
MHPLIVLFEIVGPWPYFVPVSTLLRCTLIALLICLPVQSSLMAFKVPYRSKPLCYSTPNHITSVGLGMLQHMFPVVQLVKLRTREYEYSTYILTGIY